MEREKYPVCLDDPTRLQLLALIHCPTAEHRMVTRAQIILQSAGGASNVQIAQRLDLSPQSVCLWRRRFAQEGLAGLDERPRSGRKPMISEAIREQIVVRAVNMTPPPSCRRVAEELGVSKNTVQRVWQAHDIRPHLLRTFKLSTDPHFEEKFWDVVGLYLDPPEKAVVLCCDEKTQCQALERTQPGLPLGIGHIRTRTHDYYRHGTIQLLAALDYLTGKIISRTEPRHRHQEWLKFLKQIDQAYPPDLELHLILDNYATHKHPEVKKWLNKHPRIHLHFIPTSSSWLNLLERFFGDLSEDVLRAGSFASVRELTEDILRYLAAHNEKPKRYVWKADPLEVLDKIARAKKRLEEIQNIQSNSGTGH
jgi:transposase